MAARTAKGTATDKTGALTLTVANVTIAQNARIVAGMGYDTGNGDPVITWGADTLENDNTSAGAGVAARTSSFFHEGVSDTRDLVLTWDTTAPTAKSVYVTEWPDVNDVERQRGSSQAATTNPTSGIRTGDYYDEVYCGTMVSEGPAGDTVGTVENGYTSGQRAGTAGAPPISNITVHEIYRISDEPGATEAEKTGTTSRDWSSNLVIYRIAGTPEVDDSKFMREAWDDLQETVAAVKSYGATVTIKDSADATVSITDFTTLQLKKT